MSNLTLRAEQALIGAMLAGQPLPTELARLEPEAFGHRLLSQVYTAILDLRDQHRGDELTVQVAARVNQPGADVRWLRQLRQACPSAAHIASYARMVQVAAFRRTMAQHAERITKSAGGHPDDETSTELGGMVRALNHQAHAYQAFTSVDEQQALQVWQPETQHTAAATLPERAKLEDHVLAGLLAHPQHTADVAGFVTPETFTRPQRRELFNALVTLAAQHDSIDEIIVVWEMERLRAEANLTGADHTYRDAADRLEPDPAYVARLTSMTVAAGAAIVVGRELIIEDIRQQLAHSATAPINSRTGEIDATARISARVQLDPSLQPPHAVQPAAQPTIEL